MKIHVFEIDTSKRISLGLYNAAASINFLALANNKINPVLKIPQVVLF